MKSYNRYLMDAESIIETLEGVFTEPDGTVKTYRQLTPSQIKRLKGFEEKRLALEARDQAWYDTRSDLHAKTYPEVAE